MRDGFHVALKKKLTEAIDQRAERLADGSATSFEQYRHEVGYLAAMRDVLALAAEVEKTIYGNPTNGD